MGDISGSSAVTRALSRARGRGRDQKEPEAPTTRAVGTQVGGREQSLRPPDLQTACGSISVLFPAAQGVALGSSSGSYCGHTHMRVPMCRHTGCLDSAWSLWMIREAVVTVRWVRDACCLATVRLTPHK